MNLEKPGDPNNTPPPTLEDTPTPCRCWCHKPEVEQHWTIDRGGMMHNPDCCLLQGTPA